jgi:hypothetical protein
MMGVSLARVNAVQYVMNRLPAPARELPFTENLAAGIVSPQFLSNRSSAKPAHERNDKLWQN